MMSSSICVQLQFELIHCWPKAPTEVLYLRSRHRHMAHVRAEIEVFDDDRELEFIMVKHYLERWIDTDKECWDISISCEQIAKKVLAVLQSKYGDHRDITVSVFEDGENGAVVKYTKN